MKTVLMTEAPHAAEGEWLVFPGGELEGRRPRVLCRACRELLRLEANRPIGRRHDQPPRPLCFQCYRAELDRDRAVKAAAEIDTATEARFQTTLPFEPINQARLARLQRERAVARAADQGGAGRFAERRRQAQVAARHALARIADGLRARGLDSQSPRALTIEADAIHAAELQLPDAWLPFVVSR